MEESITKKWEPFKKAFLDLYFIDTTKKALRMEFINLVQESMTAAQYETKSLICRDLQRHLYR